MSLWLEKLNKDLKGKEPTFIDAPKKLRAVLTFYPYEQKPKRKRKKALETETTVKKRVRRKPAMHLPVPSLNEFVNETRKGWRAGNAFTQDWVRRGRECVENYFKSYGAENAELKLNWVSVVAVCYWPNYATRDITNLYLKGLLDGLEAAGVVENDMRIIHLSIFHGGVTPTNPRVELYLYEMTLTQEQESQIIKIQELKNAS